MKHKITSQKAGNGKMSVYFLQENNNTDVAISIYKSEYFINQYQCLKRLRSIWYIKILDR